MKKKLTSITLALFAAFFLLSAFSVKAADSDASVYSVTSSAIYVKWNAAEGVSTYYVGIGDSADNASADCDTLTKHTSNLSYSFTNLNAQSTYTIIIKYYQKAEASSTSTSSTTTTTTATKELVTYATISASTVPNAPANLRQTSWSKNRNIATFAWDAVPNATYYEVIYVDSDGDTIKKTTKTTSYKIPVEDSNSFKLKVRAIVNINGLECSTNYTNTYYLFAQPIIRETETGYAVEITKKKKMSVKWYSAPFADGYEVYVSTKRNSGYKLVKNVKGKSKTTATIAKFNGKAFNAKKKYYVYVRAYKTKNGQKMFSSTNYIVFYNNGNTYRCINK